MARKSKADIGRKKDQKAKAKKKGEKDTSALEQSFAAAIKAAESSPESEDAWDHLEELADDLQRPDEVGELYRKVLDKRMPKDLKETLSQRAVDFHEEWFGDNPEAMSSLFLRIIDIDPSAEWAFERLTLVLTLSKQWEQLLEVYDRMLGITQEPAKRRRLLDDAAHVAKDFADKPDLAVDYLKQILTLEPQNKTLSASIERLLERLNRWQELIDLWRRQIPNLRADEVRLLRVRIATCYLEKVEDFGKTLEELRTLLGVSPGYPEGMELAERILKSEKAPAEVRRGALDLLRSNYEAAGQPGDVVRVIELGLEFADGREWIALHREAGNRLADLNRDEEAIEHYATLLRRHPADTDVRKQLTRLAQRSGRHDIYTRVLVEAADTCEEDGLKVSLLVEAAQIRRDLLNDDEGAIDLYTRVIEAGGADHAMVLSAAYVLNDLLSNVGRTTERLAVLERLATLEQATSARRSVLGEAARLAQEMGETERAIASWKIRLESDLGDLEALEKLVELYQATEQWEPLIEALKQRADTKILPQQSRSDLIRTAQVQAEKLGNPAAAIDTWLRVRDEFGEDAAVVSALDELMAVTERWSELAGILRHSAESGHGEAIRLLTRLGEIHAKHLDDPAAAVRYLGDALSIDPTNAEARDGLKALLKEREVSKDAIAILVRAFDATDDADGRLEILEQHLESVQSADEKIRILLHAAELQEKRAGDLPAAMRSLGRAMVLAPADVTIEKELLRVTSATDDWSFSAQVFSDTASAAGDNPMREAQLWNEAARIQETRLNDINGALQAFESAYRNDPRLFDVLKDVARMAASAGNWKNATWAVVELAAYRNYIDDDVMTALEQSAESGSAWDDVCKTLSFNLAEQASRLRPDLLRDFELRTVQWHKDRRNDLKEAEKALQRATVHGDAHLPTLQLLADLQRTSPDANLVETLRRIDDLTNRNLDSLFEASEVALNVCKDPKLTLSTLQRLFVRSTNLWSSAERATGEKSVEFCAEWSMERLVDHYLESGDSLKAVQLLIDGARLPFEQTKAHGMRLRAAEILAQKGERQRAINLYFEILGDAAVDVETIQKVARLCEQENRAMELLALRLRELDMTEDPDRRLELRLNISRTTGQFEEKGGRVETLLANLEERPGHEASVEELYQLLFRRGDYEKLADILTAQAKKLEEKGEGPVAARLWARVATLSEQNLRDDERAMEAHRRVVDLDCTNEALDALAKLYTKRSDPAAAAVWLERRLEGAGEKERVPILLKLSRARLTADKTEQAVETLETAFEEAPRNAEVRRLLIDIYGNQDNWAALARIYTRAAEHINDEATILAYAREAYDIHKSRLDTPAACVSVLKKAVALDPEDRDLKRMLADSLYAAEELEDAREMAEDLVKSYGRRRSPERASVHLLLSHIAKAEGDMDDSLKEMETAAKMDHMNVSIQKALADLAREMGKLEEAELAYRTLLLTVRRHQADRGPYETVGQSEVLMELSRIAADRGQEDQASELRESAIEAVTQNDTEAPKLQASLKNHGEIELLRRVLNTRLGLVKTQRKKGLIMADIAELLETGLEKSDEALEMRLRAVETDPILPQHHEAARNLAVSQGQLERYVSTLEGLLKKKRRTGDAHVRCEVLLRLGEIMEKEHDDLEKAADYYEKAEETGVREADVWRAAARVAGARGFVDQQMRLLNLLASMGEEETETRSTALYSLAEIQLAQEETLEEGIATLRKALEEDARYERAGVILGRASEANKDNDEILALYEQVARKSEDERRLLHFLEQRVSHPKATPEEVKEAADLAVKFEEWDRAEALMLRAVEIGTEVLDDQERVSWAFLSLAQRRKEARDLAGAVKWLVEAAEAAEAESVFALAREVADLGSGPDGDLTLVARLYESLLERYPSTRDVWEPLAGIYAKMGEIDRLQIIVDETLDSLPDAGDRNALRIQYALALMGTEDRVDDAVEILRTVLLEDPENPDAKQMLIRHFERTGKEDDLLELLQNNLFAAQGRKDLEAIKDLTIQLGKRLERNRTEEAVSLYRSSLDWVKDDRDIIKALLKILGPDHDPRERAELMERLLQTEDEDKVVKLTFDLQVLYYTLEDEAGALRALEGGYRRVPGTEKIFKRLEEIYEQSGNFRDLARKIVEAAQLKGDSPQAVKLFLKAAAIFRDTINDQAAAMESLKMATEMAPDDIAIAVELTACMKAAGEHGQAVERISDILETNPPEDMRLRLFRMRAEIHTAMGQETSALADLEEAYGIDRSVAPELEEVLKRLAALAIEKRDADMERKITLRFVDLLLDQGSREEGHALLDAWTSQNPGDREALYKLRDMDMKDGNWEGVANTCNRLLSVEEGEDLIRCILLLSQAYGNIDRLTDARAMLEHAYRNQPDVRQIRDELRKVYETLGVRRELAALLLEDSKTVEDADEKIVLLRRAGELLIEGGDATEAIPILESILSLAPDDLETTAVLADAYVGSMQLDSADIILDSAVEELKGRRSPELALLQHRKARVAGARGDRDLQLELLQQAFKTDRNNGIIAAELANLAEATENWDLAITALRNIPLIKTECPISKVEAYLRQGKISLRMGDQQRAVFWAKKAQKEDPDSIEAAEFLRQLGEG